MAAHLRTKRNFKALQLPQAVAAAAPASTDPLAPRGVDSTAPAPGMPAPGLKKRPAPLNGLGGSGNGNRDGKTSYKSPSAAPGRRSTIATLSNTLAKLEMNGPDFDLKKEDLKNLEELGQGNGGSVMKVEHVPTGTIMAKKVCPFCYYPVACALKML